MMAASSMHRRIRKERISHLERLLLMPASDVAFLTGLAIWLTAAMISTTFFAKYLEGTPLTAIRIGSLALMVLGELWHGTSFKSILSFGILAVLTYSLLKADAAGLIVDGIVIAYLARNHSFDAIAKISLVIFSLGLLLIVSSSQLGIIKDYVSYRVDGIPRHFLGFKYALTPSLYMLMVCALVVYLRKEKLTFVETLLLASLVFYIFTKTNSRLSFALTLLLLFLALSLKLIKKKEGLKKAMGILILPSYIVLCILSIWLTWTYEPSSYWMYQLNDFLGNRLALGHDAICTYGISAFGQSIVFYGNGLSNEGTLNTSGAYNYVDCAYVRALVSYGWTFLLVLIVLLTAALYLSWRRGDNYYLLVNLILALHCVVDDLTLRPYFNVFFFAVVGVIFAAGMIRKPLRKARESTDITAHAYVGSTNLNAGNR